MQIHFDFNMSKYFLKLYGVICFVLGKIQNCKKTNVPHHKSKLFWARAQRATKGWPSPPGPGPGGRRPSGPGQNLGPEWHIP